MIVGLCITAILKTYFHLSHMGVPGRAWRAMLRPDRSWISRGLLSIGLFSGAAILHILLTGFGLGASLGLTESAAGSAFLWIVRLAAVVGAMLVMLYHGFAIADSPSISFWNTGLMPISSFAYSAMGGTFITMNLDRGVAHGAGTGLLPPIHSTGLVLIVVAALLVAALLNGANRGSPGARMSRRLLTSQGPYVKWFFGVVVLVGLVLPFVLQLAGHSLMTDLVSAVAVLAGYYAFRSLVFKVGLYDPPISFAPES
jgi:formate-dependent nitrite reductase membrane component NrfD